jgi:hypothetical protein
MAKRAFAFALGQRVNVPGKKGVQGVVSLPACINEFETPKSLPLGPWTFYMLRWLGDDGAPQCGWFPDAHLIEANAPPAATVEAEPAALFLSRVKDVWVPSKSKRKPSRHRKARR